MNITERILKLFKIEVPFCKQNVECALRNATGDQYRKALIFLIRKELKAVLEQQSKEQLIEMLLDSDFPRDCEDSEVALFETFFVDHMRSDIFSIVDFVEYIDDTLPKELKSSG